MKKLFIAFLFCCQCLAALAGEPLSLDSCRSMALRNNRSLAAARANIDKAHNERKAAFTNYLPKIDITAAYMRTGDELSLLSDDQKAKLSSLGTSMSGQMQQMAGQILAQHPELAPLAQNMGAYLGQAGAFGNSLGQGLVDALHTDTRNLTVGAVILKQPLYMGGKIKAYDRITRLSEQLAGKQLDAEEQSLLLSVDKAYWQIVSLKNKKTLAESYRNMLARLDSDLVKMIAEGVATKANELSVSVKLNEAEMTLTKVCDGLTLSRMALCELCGLPLETELVLDGEQWENLPCPTDDIAANTDGAIANRPELAQLSLADNIYKEKIKVERSEFLPHLALMGGYALTNPALKNGFERKFRGTWSVGVTLNIPVWNWGEGKYKVRAARAEARMATLRREDAEEKIRLQVTQQAFRVNEANKKLLLSLRNLDNAEENLRTARLGFKEGVIPTSDLLAAQTAWLQAHSDKIDAQIDIMISRAEYQKAIGELK